MKVTALFEENGKIIALFHQSAEPDAPKLSFAPAEGRRSGVLEVPPELRHLKPAQLHKAVHVDLSSGTPKLIARSE
jgi:hypothetical protein